ncbi:MAG: putative RND superfamily exporter protein [Gammaproteobacteria bacterium]|jgi:predicted RND superfamily exporter protein
MISAIYHLGTRYSSIVITIIALITVIASFGLTRLEIDTSFDSLIPNDDPARVIYQRTMSEFGSDNKTIIYIEDEALWSTEKLLSLQSLHTLLTRINHVNHVDSLFSLRAIRGHTAGGKTTVKTETVMGRVPRDSAEVMAAKKRALGNPLYVGNLVSENGRVTAMILTIENSDAVQGFDEQVYLDISDAINAHSRDFERLFQVGPPRVNTELRTSLVQDFTILGPLSAFVLIASILFFMRSALAAVVPIITSTLTILWTFGLLGWIGIPLNILSAMIPCLIIVIGSTEDTHIVAAFFRGLALGEKPDPVEAEESPRQRAIHYMATHTGLPLVLTVITTAFGFAANLFSSISLIQDFALASTFAILANGVITVLVVPILLAQFGPKSHSSEPKREAIYKNNLANKIVAAFRVSQDQFPIYTLSLTAILCAFFAYQASHLYVTNDPMSYFHKDRQLVQEAQLIHQELAGIKVFFITLESSVDKAFLEPANLLKLEKIQNFVRKQEVFDNSLSLADHLKYVNREFQGQFSNLSLPKSRQMAAQYLLFFQRSELEPYVSHDYSRANIVVRHNINDSNTLNRYVQELDDAVKEIAGPNFESNIIGENLMVNKAAEGLMLSQIKALGLLLALIFILMSIMFTSFKGGAIAMIPSLIPIILMFGIMGFLGIPLNPGTAMVSVIAVGIAIDGTIHLLARYNELCRSTSDCKSAVNQAVNEVATPLIVSSFALSLGFGILLFSNFTVVAQFGALAAATMLISIFANLLITPIVMARIRLVGLYQIISMQVDESVLDESPLFKDMTRYQRRKAILISEIREFSSGEKLLEQNTIGRSMYMILDGEAKVIRRDADVERVLAHLTPGQIIGEFGYIRAVERTADVTATTAVTALHFDYERMQKDLKFFPHIAARLNFNISAILGGRLADVLAERHN